MANKRSTKIKRVVKNRAEVERDSVLAKAIEIGIPVNQIVHGNFAQVDVPRIDKGVRVTTTKTLVNNGGTPIARWKSARLLTERQVLAIDHCEAMWVALNGRSVVMNYGGVGGGSLSANTGMREQEALDNLKRIKGYFPAKWWALFESVCRFDEPAGFAGSRLTECRNEQVAAARTTVQVVADIIAMNERL